MGLVLVANYWRSKRLVLKRISEEARDLEKNYTEKLKTFITDVNYTIDVKCRIAGIYYESFNFVNFVNRKASAKIKASIYLWIHNKFKNSKYFF